MAGAKKKKKSWKKWLLSSLSGPILIVVSIGAIIGGAEALASAICDFFASIGNAVVDFFTTDWESQVDPEILKDSRLTAKTLVQIIDGESGSFTVNAETLTITYMKKTVITPEPTPVPSPIPVTPSPQPTNSSASKKQELTSSTGGIPSSVPITPPPPPPPPPEPIIVWSEEETTWQFTTENVGLYPYRLPWQFIYAIACLYDTDIYDPIINEDVDYTDEELEEKEKELEESEEGGGSGEDEEDEPDKESISTGTIKEIIEAFSPQFEFYYDFTQNNYYYYDELNIIQDGVVCFTESTDGDGSLYRYPKPQLKKVQSFVFTYEFESDGNGGTRLARKYIDYEELTRKMDQFGLEIIDLDFICEIVSALPYNEWVIAELQEAVAMMNNDISAGFSTELIGFDATNSPELVKEALMYLGNPYVWGGNSLEHGVDCSGYVQQIYKKFGYDLPRVSKDQAKSGVSIQVDIDNFRPGDLLFYGKDRVEHVAIYIGDGKIVHARGKAWGIRIDSIPDFRYGNIRCARRVLGMSGGS